MSLFTKILAWFLLALAACLLGFMFMTALTFTGEHPDSPFARSAVFMLAEAERTYESGGRPALAAYLERIRRTYGGDAILTDASGRDLLTGQMRPQMMVRARQHSFLPIIRGNRIMIAREADDGRYWLFLLIPGARFGNWLLRPQFLWVLGVVILISYALAHYLTAPLRHLQGAVERFGRGDLSARVRSERADEFGHLSRTFDDMADAIQKLREGERRLLLDISHELRSPLARMSVALELARTSEDRESALARIEKEAERLSSMVSELLQITRAEGDVSALRLAPVRLDDLLRELVEDCHIEARDHPCVLRLEGDRPAIVEGDRELLRRAVENAIRNAIRYAPAGSEVELSLALEDHTAAIRVRDHGPGVPAASLPHIFDAFYRVDADRNRSTGGVGLGLAIAKRAVELHGGSIRAENVHPGLLVEIRLPVK